MIYNNIKDNLIFHDQTGSQSFLIAISKELHVFLIYEIYMFCFCSECLDISEQIQSLQTALKVQKEDVYGGIKCIPLWKPTLKDISSAVKETEIPKEYVLFLAKYLMVSFTFIFILINKNQ